MTAIFRTAMTFIALLAAGATAAEPAATPALTKEQAMDIWRAEQLIVRTSPEWLHTMFDTFPVTVLVNMHADLDDLIGDHARFDWDYQQFVLRHPELTIQPPTPPSPILIVEVPGREAMLDLLRDAAVRQVSPNVSLTPLLASALPMVNPMPIGQGGAGTSIAVIDTGILQTSPVYTSGKVASTLVFNSCTNIQGDPWDRSGHGTVVASVASAAAPQARIISLKAVNCSGVLDAVSAHAAQLWVYQNAQQYNIAAVVMAYAGTIKYSGTCDNDSLVGLLGPLLARDVLPVPGSGNDGWKTGLPAPACASSALPVGMVGSRTGGGCAEWGTTTGTPFTVYCVRDVINAGQIPYLSNSGSRLVLLAPGGVIVSGGWPEPLFGTSLAAPLVAGGVAVAQAIYKRSGSAMLAAMKAHPGSMLIKDTGNNLSRPLIDITRLAADAIAARPPGYVPGPPGSTPGGSSPVTVATTTTAPVTLLTPPPAVIGGCSSCHGI